MEKPEIENEIEKNMDTNILPDEKIGILDMHEYGYLWEEMLPLTQESALKMFNHDMPVYKLYKDGSEATIDDRAEIMKHDGMFGIEKEDWERYLINGNNIKPYKDTIVINGTECYKIDEWQKGSVSYVLGQDINFDMEWYIVQATETLKGFKGIYTQEYDRCPSRETVEESHVGVIITELIRTIPADEIRGAISEAERYVIGKDFNTKDWFVYDNTTDRNMCYCNSEEEAQMFVIKRMLADGKSSFSRLNEEPDNRIMNSVMTYLEKVAADTYERVTKSPTDAGKIAYVEEIKKRVKEKGLNIVLGELKDKQLLQQHEEAESKALKDIDNYVADVFGGWQ